VDSKTGLVGPKAPLGVRIPYLYPGDRTLGFSIRIYTASATVAE